MYYNNLWLILNKIQEIDRGHLLDAERKFTLPYVACLFTKELYLHFKETSIKYYVCSYVRVTG